MAVRFIDRLRERVSQSRAVNLVYSLPNRDAEIRLPLMIKILQDEERHSTLLLSVTYDEITEDGQKVVMTTRSAAEEMMSVYADSQVYHRPIVQKKNIEV